MSKIEEKFKELKGRKEKALIIYLTAGFPSFSSSIKIMEEIEKYGVDLLEIGIPFSDPIADGPIIQFSSQKALEKGINVEKVFKLCNILKTKIKIPYLLMSYYNPIYKYGLKNFAKNCFNFGVSGVIVPDLPIEESFQLYKILRSYNIDLIFFTTPYTSEERIKKIVSVATGFIYFVSRAGVTGPKKNIAPELKKSLKKLKEFTDLPIAVGFGISEKKQVYEIGKISDGIIIGSYIIQKISEGKITEMKNTLKEFKKLLTNKKEEK